MRRTLCTALALVALAVASPRTAAAPQGAAAIAPGKSIAGLYVGEERSAFLARMGAPAFYKESPGDGLAVYEWGLRDGLAPFPSARLWILVDTSTGGKAFRVGTEDPRYRTREGLGVGTPIEDFFREYGPARHPAPGIYVFRNGLGVRVDWRNAAESVWVERP